MRSSIVVLALALVAPALGAAFERRQAATCVLQCIAASTAGTNCATADTVCLCTSPVFIKQVAECLPVGCSAEDAAAGVTFGQNYCASVGATIVIPAGASATSAAAPAETSAAAATTSAAVVPSSVAPTISAAVVPTSVAPTSAAAAAAATSAAKIGDSSFLEIPVALLALVGAGTFFL